MTDAPVPAAGWYPDPEDARRHRWWDGNDWTDHVLDDHGAAESETDTGADDPPAARGIDGWPIWLAAFLPLAPLIVLPFWDVAGYLRSMAPYPGITVEPDASGLGAAWLVLNLVSVLAYGLSVVLAWLDWRTLHNRGLASPFHWAFSLFGPIVYMVGRSVVVRRRLGTGGLGPLWALAAVQAVCIVGAVAWLANVIVAALQTLRFS